jgi:AraC-like DNA-binding protein
MNGLIHIGLIPEPLKRSSTHQHFVWEIVYYTYGEGTITVDGKQIPFSQKHIICIPPNTPHYETSDSGFRNIHLLVQSLDNIESKTLFLTDNDTDDLFNVLMLLYREFHKKRKYWLNITEGILSVLCHYILSSLSEKRKNFFIEGFENLLISNISNSNFSVEEEINKVGLAKDYFRRLFKSETGKTPLQYLTEKRIDYAISLLESRDVKYVKIADIADMTGFKDPFYFSRVFKKITGKSPNEWMKRNNTR